MAKESDYWIKEIWSDKVKMYNNKGKNTILM